MSFRQFENINMQGQG